MRLGITGGRVSTPASLPGDSLPAARNPTRRSNQRTRRSATSHCVSGACRVLHGMRMHVHVCGVGVGPRACMCASVCLSVCLRISRRRRRPPKTPPLKRPTAPAAAVGARLLGPAAGRRWRRGCLRGAADRARSGRERRARASPRATAAPEGG